MGLCSTIKILRCRCLWQIWNCSSSMDRCRSHHRTDVEDMPSTKAAQTTFSSGRCPQAGMNRMEWLIDTFITLSKPWDLWIFWAEFKLEKWLHCSTKQSISRQNIQALKTQICRSFNIWLAAHTQACNKSPYKSPLTVPHFLVFVGLCTLSRTTTSDPSSIWRRFRQAASCYSLLPP